MCTLLSIKTYYDNFHLFHSAIRHFLHVRRSHAYISYEYLYSGVDNGDRRTWVSEQVVFYHKAGDTGLSLATELE